jgi:hypothetical protein
VTEKIKEQIEEVKKHETLKNYYDRVNISLICEEIINICIKDLKSKDNCSLCIVYFQNFTKYD